jgi:3'(2'), 5'-bisphosphate nucleotidase
MTTSDYITEQAKAIEAVLDACALCEDVRAELVEHDTVAKNDRSPVTIADFGAQAVVNHHLAKAFPEDAIVAEEDAAVLREQPELAEKVLRHVTARSADVDMEGMLAAIDRGNSPGGPTGRHWVLDPIDGTKGFLRGGQYAVALALLEHGRPVVGVLGCPRLPLEAQQVDGEAGCLFIARKGGGSTQRAITNPTEKPVRVTSIPDPASASFCESVESGHSAHGVAAEVAAQLGITRPAYRIDSQCKYAAVARGDASIYLRLPTRKDYEEKIWDHAAGWLVVKEAGGQVTDVNGRALNFSLGRTLRDNSGVVATNGLLHESVISAVQSASA